VLSLHLLRHGETDFSRQDRFCGNIDADLTTVGHQMAEAFADVYGRFGWQGIYTSTRRRTIATAAPLATRAALNVHRTAGLDEIFFGDWQGRSKDEVAALDPDRFRRWLDDPTMGAPGGETVGAVADRAMAVIGEVRARHTDGNVLVVSHKTVLRVILCMLTGTELRHYRDRIAQPVAALSVIDFKQSGPTVRTLADLGYLPPSLAAHARGEIPATEPAAAPAIAAATFAAA
jgi:probable phosphoglycerate mutase